MPHAPPPPGELGGTICCKFELLLVRRGTGVVDRFDDIPPDITSRVPSNQLRDVDGAAEALLPLPVLLCVLLITRGSRFL